MIGNVSIILAVASLVGIIHSTAPAPVDCAEQCNTKWQEQYRTCNAVLECQTYVEHQLKSCLHECVK